MRYYIEAYDGNHKQMAGMCNGQAALGEMKKPTMSALWKGLFGTTRPAFPRVSSWRLVDANDRIVAICINPHFSA